jgi:hypothetical protein
MRDDVMRYDVMGLKPVQEFLFSEARWRNPVNNLNTQLYRSAFIYLFILKFKIYCLLTSDTM